MPRINVNLIQRSGEYVVDLPEFQMVAGTEDYTTMRVDVVVPARICDPATNWPSAELIRRLYRNHPYWGDPAFVPDIGPPP